MGADNLKGTLFEKIGSVLSTKDSIPGKVAAGKYRIYLLWYPALKLKLRTDFMEPAHLTAWKEPAHPGAGFLGSLQAEISTRYVGKVPFHGEPVHWFDPGYVIAAEEAILIHAIDEVYPELRLADRITAGRQAARIRVRPESRSQLITVNWRGRWSRIKDKILRARLQQYYAATATRLQ